MKPLLSFELERYIHDHTRPRPSIFDELRDLTYETVQSPQMQVGRVEGTLLKMLVAISSARRVIEIGTFTGYSALCMAEALPDDGELVTCDVDPEVTGIARGFFDRTPHGKKIRICLGPALDTLRSLTDDAPFCLAFIDADKEHYIDYYEALVPRLRSGGLLVADNTLWSGQVVDESDRSASTLAIKAFNERVARDPRVENVLLSVRDGMMLARKL